MVIAWILFASTGILMPKYYRYLGSDTICGLPVWFFIHRPLMIISAVITFTSFIVILSDKNWKWVIASNNTSVVFTHSIFGIVTISFTVVQVIKF